MTYSASHQLLAPVAKMLDAPAMALFCKAANDASELGYDHNACVTAGWSEVKKNYTRPPNGGKWMRKEGPDAGDVHVDVPMGGKKDKETGKGEPDDESMEKRFKIEKVDATLGLVFGWAIVCTEDGEDYIDTQGDHIPEDAMMKAATDFALNSRVAKDMHAGDQIGDIVFMFPMAADVAKSMGIECNKTGLMIAMKPSPEVFAKFKSGEYTGFSIGGAVTRSISGVVT